ncbi:DMT family transporter [Szabonella alba]|uniref:DMT family transporter n=1 Tax=Szabonella alba TaxID=2804194 RepID=A0A8K0V7Z2_9RHOB|nr:DMT family transporter [Szabonella alba]MBL4915921.1 DMT family transporter [Szabonella alba]
MDLRAILMGIGFVLMWSSAFATAKIIVADAPPLMSLAARFLVTGLIAVALARAMGQSWHLPGGFRGTQARAVLIFGLCQNALYLGLYFVAMQWIDGSLAAIIASSMPLIVAGLGWAFLGQRSSPLGLLGLVTGMAGVLLIMGTRLSGGADPLGVAICILGALALAIATLSVRGASGSGNLLMIVGLQMLVGAGALGLVSALTETPEITLSARWIIAFVYQCLIPGLAATLLWFALVGRIGAVRAATFHFLNPAFGVAIAAVLLGETLGPWDLVGVAITALGILAVQLSRA